MAAAQLLSLTHIDKEEFPSEQDSVRSRACENASCYRTTKQLEFDCPSRNMESVNKLIEDLTNEADVSGARVIKPGFERTAAKLDPVKPDIKTRGQRRREARQRKEASAGAKWFDLPAKDLSVEDKLTLDALRLRDTLTTGKFYKKKTVDKVAKHFQVGTVVEHPADFYTSRATRKERKQTLVDELIADAEFKHNVKKRYQRLRASDAIRKREKALADRRRALQGKKKVKV